MAVEIGGSNTTSVNVVNGEKKNSNDASLSASFFGLFYSNEKTEISSKQEVGIKVEKTIEISKTSSFTFGAKAGARVSEEQK